MNSEEHTIEVGRTARYRVLGDPATADEVWFVLHGYGQLAAPFIDRFRTLPGVGSRRAVVAPEALSRFYLERDSGPHGPESRVGATWMTRADRLNEIRDYVAYLDRVAEAVGGEAGPDRRGGEGSTRRRVVLGFSQGSETASRWVTLGEIRPAELVLWGGGLASDVDPAAAAAALRDVRVRLVTGDSDEWGARKSVETEAFLATVGLEADSIPFPGGHTVDAEVLRRVWPG